MHKNLRAAQARKVQFVRQINRGESGKIEGQDRSAVTVGFTEQLEVAKSGKDIAHYANVISIGPTDSDSTLNAALIE